MNKNQWMKALLWNFSRILKEFFQIHEKFLKNSKVNCFLYSEFLKKCLPGRRWWIRTSRRRQSLGLFVIFVLNLVRFQTFANSFILVFSRTGITAGDYWRWLINQIRFLYWNQGDLLRGIDNCSSAA